MIAPTDGAWLDTNRTDRHVIDVTFGKMIVAKAMVALLCGQMVSAEQRMAEITLPHTCFAALFATLGAMAGFNRKLSTAWTFIQTFQTERRAVAVALIVARTDLSPAFAASDEAVGAETLAGRSADANLRAVLLATWATSGTISTNERMFAFCVCHRIGAQMAAALALATMSAFDLTGEADVIAAHGAAGDMIGAGALATSPAGSATTFAISLATDRTGGDATFGAKNFLAGVTLFNALVTADMTVAV
jgi:hypothetical protein